MYHRLIDDYLTHYQPRLKEELLRAGTLQDYLDEQVTAMQNAKAELLEQMARQHPQMSQSQRELEADQAVRELFLTPH
ncbi:MAG: hypothetical protein R2932_48570 [Caldilineaceae bacterium]